MKKDHQPSPPLEIDFLPPRYREENKQRRVNTWRLAMVGIFLAGVGVAVAATYRGEAALQAEVASLDAAYRNTEVLGSRLAHLQQILEQQRSRATMFAYIQHPWPRTQILAALLEPLPAEITVTQIALTRERKAATDAASQERPRSGDAEPAADTASHPAAKRDLDKLREQYDNTAVVVLLAGTTSDVGALHAYLSHVSSAPLIEHAELKSVQALGAAGIAAFQARVSIRPAHGQPDGPRAPVSPRLPAANRGATASTSSGGNNG